MPPLSRISFDRIAHLYDQTRGLPANQMDAILKVFYRELSQYDSVLEVGVGTGRFAVPLQQSGIRLYGVDISTKMVNLGREKGLRDVVLADALQLPFRDKALETSYSVHLLHLVPDWKRTLREILRVSRRAYYTVTSRWEGTDPSPYRVYWDSIRKMGFDKVHPGLHERDLAGEIAPTSKIEVGSFIEKYTLQEALDELDGRIFSGQWRLPEEAHKGAMETVRGQFSNGFFKSSKRVEIVRWDVKDLVNALGR